MFAHVYPENHGKGCRTQFFRWSSSSKMTKRMMNDISLYFVSTLLYHFNSRSLGLKRDVVLTTSRASGEQIRIFRHHSVLQKPPRAPREMISSRLPLDKLCPCIYSVWLIVHNGVEFLRYSVGMARNAHRANFEVKTVSRAPVQSRLKPFLFNVVRGSGETDGNLSNFKTIQVTSSQILYPKKKEENYREEHTIFNSHRQPDSILIPFRMQEIRYRDKPYRARNDDRRYGEFHVEWCRVFKSEF